MNWYLRVLKNYAGFSGRATRSEYWMFVLFNIIFTILAMILDIVLEIAIDGVENGLLYIFYGLAVLIPVFAVTVRRLHDIGKSGWMIFIILIPIVGVIWLLVLLTTDSSPLENQYGVNPKEILEEEYFSNESTGDTLILIVVIWMIISRIFLTLAPKFNENYYLEEWFISIQVIMTIIWSLIPIGLAFAIKDKTKQIVFFVVGGIYFIYSLSSTFM